MMVSRWTPPRCSLLVVLVALGAASHSVAVELESGRLRRAALPPENIRDARRLAARQAPGGPRAAPSGVLTLGQSFDGLDSEDQRLVSDLLWTPADPCGAVGPDHLFSLVSTAIRWTTRAGTEQNTQRLGLNGAEPRTVDGSFFEPVNPVTSLSGSKVLYDLYANRFVVMADEWFARVLGDAIDLSTLFLAVSDQSDPNGTWIYRSFNTSRIINGVSNFAYAPRFAIGPDAIYITANYYKFTNGSFTGWRMLVVDKAALYAGQAPAVWTVAPGVSVGLPDGVPGGPAFTPARMHGPTPGDLGMVLVSSGWTHDHIDDVFVGISVFRALSGAPQYLAGETNFGNRHNGDFGVWTVPQKGSDTGLDAGGVDIADAVWRENTLWTVNTFKPNAGPSAGIPTAFWAKINGVNFDPVDFNFISGASLSPGAATCFPSIAVNELKSMAVGFAALGPELYVGAYYTGRLDGEPMGQTSPPRTLAAGLAPYVRADDDGVNRWGGFSTTVLDPIADTFWVYNAYAAEPGLPDEDGQDGLWATRWGAFSLGPVAGDFDLDGDVDRADLERFAPCATGSDVPYVPGSMPPDCTFLPDADGVIPPDLNHDGDVDQDDFAILQRCFSGENSTAEPTCAD